MTTPHYSHDHHPRHVARPPCVELLVILYKADDKKLSKKCPKVSGVGTFPLLPGTIAAVYSTTATEIVETPIKGPSWRWESYHRDTASVLNTCCKAVVVTNEKTTVLPRQRRAMAFIITSWIHFPSPKACNIMSFDVWHQEG